MGQVSHSHDSPPRSLIDFVTGHTDSDNFQTTEVDDTQLAMMQQARIYTRRGGLPSIHPPLFRPWSEAPVDAWDANQRSVCFLIPRYKQSVESLEGV